jgi:hypothetical protein
MRHTGHTRHASSVLSWPEARAPWEWLPQFPEQPLGLR